MNILGNRESFYQWDINQKLTSNLLAIGDEVHFTNMYQHTALVTIAYELDGKIVVDVPNILLQSSASLRVYWMYIDGEGEFTKAEYSFNITARKKPADYVYTETEIMSYHTLNKRLSDLEGEGLTKAVQEVLKTMDVESISAKIGTVTLLSSAWAGKDKLYSQVVNIDGVTENSQVDLTPNIQQLAVFYEKDLSFVTENDNGVITVYAIGQKPMNDYTIQVTITEVEYA